MTDHRRDPPQVPPRQPQDHPAAGDDRLVRDARRRRGRLPGRRRRLAVQRRRPTTGSRCSRSRTSSTTRRRTRARACTTSAFEYETLRRAERELPAAARRPGIEPDVLPRPRDDVLLLLRRSRRQPRRAAGRQLRRLGEVEASGCAPPTEFKANPIGAVRRPRAGRRRPRRGRCASRRSTPRRWPAATRPSRPRSRSRRCVMRLCRFDAGGGPRHGIVEDGTSSTATTGRAPSARRGPPARARPPAQVPGDRAQLRRPHRRERAWRRREFPVFFNKQVDLRGRARRRRPHAARLEPARLRGRAGGRDRHALPPRAGRARARGDRRLHDRQRRLGARLAAAQRRR